MKRKHLIILAALLCVMIGLVGLVSCGGGECEHPEASLTFSDGRYDYEQGKYVHNIFCNECHRHVSTEQCDTPNGECGECSKCGSKGEHKYDGFADYNDESHNIKCSYCKSVKSEAHELKNFNSFGKNLTYHGGTLECLCGYKAFIAGDHTTEAGDFVIDSVSHRQICDLDACGREYNFGIHELKDGKCEVCGYEASALAVSDNLEFTLSEDESYYILTKINIPSHDYGVDADLIVIIPDSYNGKPVGAIGKVGNTQNSYSDDCLWNEISGVKALYIPDGVTTINDFLFGHYNYCSGLEYVRFPSSIEYIGKYAFNYADIVDINIPSNEGSKDNRVIMDYAFAENTDLRTLSIGEGFVSIGEGAFGDSAMLTHITLPSTIESIAKNAFENCDSIESISLRSWNEITERYQDGNEYYLVTDNCLIERETKALVRSNGSMIVPSSVKTICKYAFVGDGKFYGESYENAKNYDVKLPAALKAIESGALANPAISSVAFDGVSLTFAAESGCVYEKETGVLIWGNASCVIPEGVSSIASKAFFGLSFDKFTVPSSVKNMESGAFTDCTFKEIVFADGANGLGFKNCTTEQEVLTIPGSMKTVDFKNIYGSSAKGLVGFKKIVFSEGVERIENIIVGYSDGSGEIKFEFDLPSTLASVSNQSAFGIHGTATYEGMEYLGDAENPYYALLGPTGDSRSFRGTVKIHPETRVIADSAFAACGEVTGIEFNDKLLYIGNKAFAYLDVDGEVVIPDSVKGIGAQAFNSNSYQGGFKLVLGDGLVNVGDAIVDSWAYPSNGKTEYGNSQYIGSSSNPYMLLLTFNSYDFVNQQNNKWNIHKDTKFIIAKPESTEGISFEGTSAQWGVVVKSDTFMNSVNGWDAPKFVCSDGVVDVYGATYGLEFKPSVDYPNAYSVGKGTATGDIIIPAFYKGLPVVEIQNYGFSSNITSVKLPDTIIKIGDKAFYTSAITEIIIPDSVKIIGESAFEGCSALVRIVLGKGVERIESAAFAGTGITSLILPDSVEYVGSTFINRCESLVLNEYDNAYYLGSEANPYFVLIKVKDANANSCNINSDTVIIAGYAFEGSKLTSVTIPDSVKFIGTRAFHNCDSLISVVIGKGVNVLDDGQFLSCDALTSVEFGGDMIVIGFQSFDGCAALKNIVLPASVQSISLDAFGKSFVDYSTVITFGGTIEKWNAIIEDSGMDDYFTYWSLEKVICSDGEVTRDV